MTDLNAGYPLVTIGITCFNAQDSIESAINSALSQTWPNIEIIVCDDNSSDSSAEKIKYIKTKFPSINVINRERNGGPAASRNSIINEAKGKYIVFFDDDDESHADRVAEQVKLIKEYRMKFSNTILLCFASGVRKYSSGYSMKIEAIGSKLTPPQGMQVVNYLLFNEMSAGVFYGGGIPACSLAMELNDLIKLGGFDEEYRRVEDADLAIRAGLKGALFIGCINELYTQYSTVGNDKTAEKNFESELILIKKNDIYLKRINMYSYAISWTKLRYLFFSRKRFQFFCVLFGLLLCYPIRASKHFFRSSLRRYQHEKKIKKGSNVIS